MEKDYFHTFNQNLIKIYINRKRFILTICVFPHLLSFVFSKISMWKGPYLVLLYSIWYNRLVLGGISGLCYSGTVG